MLDLLLLYLRLVHSLDYYNLTEYANEDEMPNRCGLFHVRGRHRHPEAAADTHTEASPEDAIVKHMANAEKKLEAILSAGLVQLAEKEAQKLGLKTEADELEKFMMANCQELAQDKWLCPLSGKKFKGPEFVKKHIHNRFPERVAAVRHEAQFFNNYLRDPCRPELPELTNSGSAAAAKAGAVAAGGGGGSRGEAAYGERDGATAHAQQRKRGSIRERLGVPVGPPGIREVGRVIS